MSDCEITCIVKPHPHSPYEHITHVGNLPTWIWEREKVIASIDAKTNTFYVITGGKRANVKVVREAGKAAYLKTHADGYDNNNLLSLNQCPIGR